MKKLFSLALVLFAMLFAANAQVTVILEAHDVWQDGSGYQLLLDADHNTYGTTIPATGALTSSGDVSASVYAEFEYKVPTNADGSLTTQNIVYDGSVSITIPAGTYDYCITNPTPGDRMWIASNNGTQPGRADDFVFEDGHIYHFLVGRVGSNDGVTLTVSIIPTGPTIDAPAAVNFGTVILNNSGTQTANVNAYLLTNSITATTAAPFTISTNGTTFGTTATLDTTGGQLYIKYTPTAPGNNNGTVILSSVGASNDTIALTGNCLDCSNITLPYSCDFTDVAQYDCWTIVDANNDGTTFTLASGAASYSYSSSNAANDYLISPSFAFTGAQTATFDYKVASSSYPEIIEVFAIGADTVRLTQPETVTSTSYQTKTLDLSNLNGNYSIAIHCISAADMFRLDITNFSVFGSSMAIVNVNPTSIAFSTIPTGTTEDNTFNISTTNLNEAITIATAAPFGVSLDGTTYNTTVTIPADTTFITSTPVHVHFAPTTAGTFNGEVVVSTTTTADTISLSGAAIECNAITNFPFTEGFESSIGCWTMVSIDPTNDSRFGIYEDAAAYEGSHDFRFSSFSSATDYNQYLITPELTLNASETYSAQFYYKGYNSNENFRVMYSTTTNDVTSFTMLADYTNVATDWTQTAVVLPAGTKYVAINYYGNYQYYLYIDNFSVDVLAAAPTVTIEGPSIAQNGTAVEFTAISPLADTFAWTVDGAAASSTTNTLSYTFNTPGNHTVAVTATNVIGSTTATHTVEVVSCDAESLPYSEDFNSGIVPPICWSSNDAENFGVATVDDAGDLAIYFASPDMLVSPELSSTEPMHVKFGYRSYLGNYGTSTFRVGFSSTDNNASSFTWFPAISINAYPADDVIFFDFNSDLPANTKYVAIDVIELGTYSFYSDAIYIDNFLVDNNVSINEYNNNVSVYPNPANNSVNVNATSNINMVEVFNMMGQRVAVINANDTNVQINTTALNNGMYMMRITTENGVSNQKLMIAR